MNFCYSGKKKIGGVRAHKKDCSLRESNAGPLTYKASAITNYAKGACII